MLAYLEQNTFTSAPPTVKWQRTCPFPHTLIKIMNTLCKIPTVQKHPYSTAVEMLKNTGTDFSYVDNH